MQMYCFYKKKADYTVPFIDSLFDFDFSFAYDSANIEDLECILTDDRIRYETFPAVIVDDCSFFAVRGNRQRH